MKNVYIDCGSHYGQGINQFIRMYNMTPEWDIYTFEANPTTYKYFLNINKDLIEKYNIKHFNKAIFTYDGEITINEETPPNEPNTGMGSSVISLDIWDPQNGTLRDNFKSKSTIPCIDFSNFLKQFIGCNVLTKIDIEGAEYDVLEKLIKDDTIKILNRAYVEFHCHYFKNSEEMEYRDKLIRKKFLDLNIELIDWH
jgi:hypothetical protein